jgi:uncharacterized protein YaaN involved in tellurite resistance
MELLENQRVAFYNSVKYNQPSHAAKEAIRKVDEINNRLLSRNCSSNLHIATGQIQWDNLIEAWKSILRAAEDTSRFTEERKQRTMSRLVNMCKELHYPSEWTTPWLL